MKSLRSHRQVFYCGSASDPAGKEGLAAVTAQLVLHGATLQRSYREKLDDFFRMAAHVDIQVDQELTVLTSVVHEDHAASLAAILAEPPAFLPEDFERVRTDLLNALTVELRGSNDEELAKEMLYVRLYRGHPYGHPTIGTVAGLTSLTLDDVKAFYRDFLLPGHIPVLPTPRSLDHCEAVLLDKPSARGVAMSFGHPIAVTRGHADYPALLLAQAWLGQHRNGGRLFDSIREFRGLNYGDYAYIEYFPRGMYQFEPDPCLARRQQIFQVWLRPVDPSQAIFALRLALLEITRLCDQGLTQDDVDRTRQFLSRYVKLLMKTESIRQGYAIDSAFYGTSEYVEYITSSLATLTPDAIHAAIRRHLHPSRFCLVAVGPDMQSFAEVLRDSTPTPFLASVPLSADLLADNEAAARWPLQFGTIDILSSEEAFE